ncbi:MAG: ATP-binding protein [Campylobacterota bacterium]|nr:ATP-binding protein [Campylobacterota bacterium]
MPIKNLKLKAIFTLLFLFLYSISFTYNLEKKDLAVEKELDKFTQKLENSFQNIVQENYNEAESTSSILHGEELLLTSMSKASNSSEQEKNILRDKLFLHLEPLHQMLKHDGVLSFHFALSDSTSFLRMHQPLYFGDDLSLIRYTYKIIEKTHREISGLEDGRFNLSFRYLFPLFNEEEKYLGAYEISYSLEYMQQQMLEISLIEAEILEKNSLYENNLWQEKIDTIHKNIENNQTFSIYTDDNGIIKTASFLPLENTQKNDILAYIISYSESKYIKEIVDRFYTNILVHLIFLSLTLFLLYLLTLHEEKIREERERFQLAIDSSNDGILDWNIKKDITYFSPRWKAILGYADSEIGTSFSELTDRVHKDDKKRFEKEITSLLSLHQTIFELEYRMQKKDGSWIWILGRAKAHFDDNSNAIRMVGFHSNITLKKEYESQQEQLIQELKDIATSKSDFLANMSHEIRTPMNAILGFIQILIKQEEDAKKLKKFHIINDSGKSLLRIINDILDFSKIDSQKMLIEKVPYNIRDTFTHIQSLFLSKAKENKIDISLNIDNNIPINSLGDRVRIEQVTSNLLSNAIKFSIEDSVITINIRYLEDKNLILCEIIDQGIGISENKIEHIFDAFSQEDTSTTRKYGGTGLGLSISKALVKLMHGEIGVKSKIDMGSNFYFTLPLYEVQQKVDEVQNIEDKSNTISGNILIVEDNKTNQLLLTMFLSEYDLTYKIANDGVEALEILKTEKFDIILMDENMPNMNGIEATKIIRTIDEIKDIPIIAVTANAIDGDRARFIDAGMNEYISKPIDDDELHRILKIFLNKEGF